MTSLVAFALYLLGNLLAEFAFIKYRCIEEAIVFQKHAYRADKMQAV